MSRTYSLRFARDFAAVHWGLLVLVQVINFFSYLLPADKRTSAAMLFLVKLPFLQAENLLAAGLVGLLAYLLSGRLPGRLLFFIGYTVLTTYIVLNQVFYKVLFDHYRLSASEGTQTLDPRLGLSSLANELDRASAVVAGAAAAGLAWLAWRWFVRLPRLDSPPVRPWYRSRWAYAVALLFACGLPAVRSADFHNLQHHPITALAQEAWQGSPIDLADAGSDDEPEAVPEGPASVDPRLAETATAIRGRGGRPNVVLVVLESVGARQLLDSTGRPSAEDAPHLAELSKRAVVFDSFYSIFPGTVRTHVALNTGGRFLTWGSVYDMLPCEYQGPTLARAFREQGYRTALFSSARLDGEAMDSFMDSAGYETLYDFAKDAAGQVRELQIHSWGAIEAYTLGKIDRWLDGQAKSDKPFLLTYLTVATHHPYGVPPGYPAPHAGDDNLSRYRNALHYTDAALGRLLASLARRKLDQNTIIAVTGDHGEAFGTVHSVNVTHRYYIYEENVRSFLMLAHPAVAEPVVSHRLGTSGDLFPTLASLAGLGPMDVPGKDLLAGELASRFVYFYKNAYPEKWGLRDGNWKFIQSLRDREAELYDLDADPDEQHDLAASDPARVARYSGACRAWFARQNDEFAARLKDYRYPGGRALRADDWRAPGPKVLAVGYMLAKNDSRFAEQTVVAPNRPPVAWTRWVSDAFPWHVVYTWEAPSGKRYTAEQDSSPDWGMSWVDYPGPVPMETGPWKVTLSIDNKTLLTTPFTVAPPH